MSDAPKVRLHQLLVRFAARAIPVEDFASSFETVYNLELKKSDLDPAESAAFAMLFEKVIWYSPFSNERKQVPNYLGEEEIQKAAELALHMLNSGTPKNAER